MQQQRALTGAAGQQPQWRRRLALLGLGSVGAATALYSAAASEHSQAADGSAAPAASALRGVLAPTACSAAQSWPPPLLSHSQIAAALSSPVENVTPVRRGVVREFHVNQFAANTAIEDSVAIVPQVAAPPGGLLLGVFDGHSGRDASRWCSEELLPYLQYYRWSNRTDALLHKRVFLDADHHFLELALRDKRYQAGLSGACVNVAHVQGRTVRTANAGDCRTIIGRRLRKSGDAASGAAASPSMRPATHQAIELTNDHQIDTNPLERERLLRDHPDEDDIIRNNRVKGRLQPTRGMGDGFYKRREFYNARTLSKPYAHWTPPYTTAEPDITSYSLHPDDEFLVMASDGLFQDLHSQQVVEMVGEWMDAQEAEKKRRESLASRTFGSPAAGFLPNAATHLIRSALQHASEARFGRRRKENENLSLVLQLPADRKRNFHDDVSVVVLFFDQRPSAESGFEPDEPVALTTTGPPVPPTLARAIAAHLKTPAQPHALPLPTNGGVMSIKVAPLQEGSGSTGGQPQQQSTETAPIRSNL